MQPQIVHEAEVHRQHIRLKIPIQVEIDGVRYTVDDWSVGGFGVESIMTSRQPGEHFPVKLIFPFEEFEMSMRFAPAGWPTPRHPGSRRSSPSWETTPTSIGSRTPPGTRRWPSSPTSRASAARRLRA